MIFASVVFLVFFLPVVLTIYYVLLKDRRKRNIFLFLASLFFYAWGEPKFVLVMIASICFNHVIGLKLEKHADILKKKRAYLLLGIIGNISCLFVFKYLGFFVENINLFLNTSWKVPEITLPIGISFFTFQSLSYLVDVFRKEVPAQKSIISLGLYISFFPQLIAGPIVRYQSVAEQIESRKENWSDFSIGFSRFLCGLGKKVLIANQVAIIADKAFNMPINELTVGFAWLGAIAYALQIFFDFSGYSDMAIGLGKMFGFSFAENFNYPYMASSVTDFWRRWHISLSSWFRDYIYIPLGGSRVSKVRCYFNLWVVWLCTGIWHGANWSFLFWGMWHFAFLMLEKIFHIEKKIPTAIYRIWVLMVVLIGWVFFRATNISGGIAYLSVMFGVSGALIWNDTAYLYCKEYWFFLCLGIIFSMDVISRGRNKWQNSCFWQRNAVLLQPLAYTGLLLLVLSFIAKEMYNPFIYFNF